MPEPDELFEDALASLQTQTLRLKNLNDRFIVNRRELVTGLFSLYPHLPAEWVNSFQEIMRKDNEMISEYGEIINATANTYNDMYLDMEAEYKVIRDTLVELKEANG